jgi:D-inositol-3-phosphate glycosyltransferase
LGVPQRLSIHHPAGQLALKSNPFGKDVANLDLYRALALHGGLERLDFLTHTPVRGEDLAAALGATTTAIGAASIFDVQAARESGALLRGQPDIANLAWLRRRMGGDRSYSLLGLIHTLAPLATRQTMAQATLAPVHPWDALICTSPSVQSAMRRMFDEWLAYVADRFGGKPPPAPQLPLVPLGVDQAHFQGLADRPEMRAGLRAELGLSDDDVLVLWVGRLSFFEKAFPQPMFRAVEEAAAASGKRAAFVMAGWFPNPDNRALYEQAAREYAPSVDVRFMDGNDRELLGRLWAGADIFLSLVDNIQETFGITPIEAMSAGLPVVASDWDGYRYTVRDGRDGILVPTLGGPQTGIGRGMSARHAFLIDSYQSYVGGVAQHTAVNVGRAAQALAELMGSPELRRKMGASGRERVRSTFDWPVVVRQLLALVDDLAKIRAAAPDPAPGPIMDPSRGDPFHDFAGFATEVLTLETVLHARPGVGEADIDRLQRVKLDNVYPGWRVTHDECRQVLALLLSQGPMAVRDILLQFPTPRRRNLELTLAWMAKLGVLDWLG